MARHPAVAIVALADPPQAMLGPQHVDLFRELGDLKRSYSAGRAGSIATRLFRGAWAALVAGEPLEPLMLGTCAAAVAAARLGDLDRAKLQELGLDDADTLQTLRNGFDAVAAPLDPALASRLRAALAAGAPPPGPVPPFVDLLEAQPRAGVTCPGRARLMLQPAENHAEHSLVVALYGVLAAPVYDADPAAVFLAGLAHHLHSAAMPDSGFTGEMLLEPHLPRVIDRARALAFAELPPALHAPVRAALADITTDTTPAARAFHAADVIDRVLEIEQHLRRSEATMDSVLNDFELVHAGPVKAFHDQVLTQVGLP